MSGLAAALLLAAITNPHATLVAIQALAATIRAWVDPENPTEAEQEASVAAAIDAGVDFSDDVSAQFAPGGRFEGQLPERAAELVRLRLSRIAGGAVLVLALLFGGAAQAACPAPFVGPNLPAANNRVRICTPTKNAAGVDHLPGELASCEVVAVGANGATNTQPTLGAAPGTEYEVVFPNTIYGVGSATARCKNAQGAAGQEIGPQVTTFRALGLPGAPAFLP